MRKRTRSEGTNSNNANSLAVKESAGKAQRLWYGLVRFNFHQRQNLFPSPLCPHLLLIPTLPPAQWIRDLSPGGKTIGA